jgi:Tfp pilus assembly protein PilN
MIQFNLLPDIKQQYMKAQRQKHMVVFISTLSMIIAVSIFVVLLLVTQLWQKKSISDLNGDIKQYSKELSSTDDFNKILTVQNQLKSLPALHDEKAVASRMFNYTTQLTPAKASISKLDLDFAQNTVSISGSADSLATVNTYVDTLKFTKYTTNDDESKKGDAFSEVVLSAFGKNTAATTFTVTAKFDPAIFSSEQEVTLTVPQITSTRSATEQPTDLFKSDATNGATQ